MASKKKTNFPLPGDTDSSFDEEHFVLTYKPNIEFVEPEQEPYESEVEIDQPPTIDSYRDRTTKLINSLDVVSKLSDLAQKRIDERVKATGGVTIKLDPQKDAATIAAMKRRFPNRQDPTIITYDDYKNAINCLNKSAPAPPSVSVADVYTAASDPLRTDFGGYSNQHGENRVEIASNSGAAPLDLEAFQKAAVLALFALMLPLIKQEDKVEIAQHLMTAKHA